MSAATDTERAELGPAPLALSIALGLVVVEVVAEVAALWGDREPRVQASEDVVVLDLSDMRATIPGAILLTLVIASKVLFAVRTRQRHAGSALALLAAEAVGILVALGASGWPAAVRLALVANVVAVFVLVGRSLSSFPTPAVPTVPPTESLE